MDLLLLMPTHSHRPMLCGDCAQQSHSIDAGVCAELPVCEQRCRRSSNTTTQLTARRVCHCSQHYCSSTQPARYGRGRGQALSTLTSLHSADSSGAHSRQTAHCTQRPCEKSLHEQIAPVPIQQRHQHQLHTLIHHNSLSLIPWTASPETLQPGRHPPHTLSSCQPCRSSMLDELALPSPRPPCCCSSRFSLSRLL